MDKDKIDVENEDDEDLLKDDSSKWREAEGLGGDSVECDTDDEEFAGQILRKSKVDFDLNYSCQLLSRQADIEKAQQPGRHKDRPQDKVA